MIPLPSTLARLVNEKGCIVQPWNSYLQQFVQVPPAIIPITVGASPFSYTAKEPGNILITGGVRTGLSLARGNTIMAMTPTNNFVPVGINDIVIVTYTALPTIQFIPLFGQIAI